MKKLFSRKLIITFYALTWLCVILLIYMIRTNTIPENILWLIGSVFGSFVGGNVIGDHFGKTIGIADKEGENK